MAQSQSTREVEQPTNTRKIFFLFRLIKWKVSINNNNHCITLPQITSISFYVPFFVYGTSVHANCMWMRHGVSFHIFFSIISIASQIASFSESKLRYRYCFLPNLSIRKGMKKTVSISAVCVARHHGPEETRHFSCSQRKHIFLRPIEFNDIFIFRYLK